MPETAHTFLGGNDLPARSQLGFHIAELGFGTGLREKISLPKLVHRSAKAGAPLQLGYGGGVVRTGPGVNHVQNYGQGTIYLDGSDSLCLTWWGQSDIIIDNAAGDHVIYGMKAGSDRIGFRGAFADVAALLAATTLVAANTSYGDEVHTVVSLPGGGTATIMLANLRDTIDSYCLDFQGWAEPAQDYDPALFDPSVTPYATISPIELPSAGGGGGDGPKTKSGATTTLRTKDGQLVSIASLVSA